MEEEIKKLLEEVLVDNRKALELEKYYIDDIIEVALNNEYYDSLIIILSPIKIDDEYIMVFDSCSNSLLSSLDNSFETKEEKVKAIEKEENNEAYKIILRKTRVIPKEIKEKIRKVLLKKNDDIINNMKIKNTRARQINGVDSPIKGEEDVIFYAEPATQASLLDCFHKNIRTTMNDTEGVADDSVEKGICKIEIDYTKLSEENKKIINDIVELGHANHSIKEKYHIVSIFVPCSKEDRVIDVSNRLLTLVSLLKMQDMMYGYYTIEEFLRKESKHIEMVEEEASKIFKDGYTPEAIIRYAKEFLEQNLYYDEEEQLLWDSKELYEKHKEYKESISNKII